jgi:HSP20 family protein
MAWSTQWKREASGPFHVLQNELNRLLEEYLQPRFGGSDPPPTNLDPTVWSPSVDVYETSDEMIVVAEVPGVDPASIELAVTGGVLTLRGVKQSSEPESQLQLRERRFGAFHRQLVLPNEVDFDNAQAEARLGVLKIRLPKRTAAKPRTIPIRPS